MRVTISDDGRKYYEFVLDGSSHRAYLVSRDDRPQDVRESVYILMDKRKSCFYIGQTGDSDCAGFVNRSNNHKWEKRWWEQALVFTDINGSFQERIRKWLEGRLNEIAKEANTSLIMSVGKQHPENANQNWESILEWILGTCRFVGVPWAYPRSVCSVRADHRAANSRQTWTKVSHLAKALAEKYNNGAGVNGIVRLLSRQLKCSETSKWRMPFEMSGIIIDDNGYVSDWRHARNPLVEMN